VRLIWLIGATVQPGRELRVLTTQQYHAPTERASLLGHQMLKQAELSTGCRQQRRSAHRVLKSARFVQNCGERLERGTVDLSRAIAGMRQSIRLIRIQRKSRDGGGFRPRIGKACRLPLLVVLLLGCFYLVEARQQGTVRVDPFVSRFPKLLVTAALTLLDVHHRRTVAVDNLTELTLRQFGCLPEDGKLSTQGAASLSDRLRFTGHVDRSSCFGRSLDTDGTPG
jgi:hypothetical protein